MAVQIHAGTRTLREGGSLGGHDALPDRAGGLWQDGRAMGESPSTVHIGRLVEISPAPNQAATAFACLRRCEEGRTKDGQPFLDVQLSDTTAVVAGKIWSDSGNAFASATALGRGAAVKVLFEARLYRGATQLNVLRLRAVSSDDEGYDEEMVFGPGYESIHDLNYQSLVFDIETVPDTDLRRVPPTIAQAVSKHAERSDGDEGKVMSLSPLFGKVVSIAVGEGELDPAKQQRTVLAVPPPGCDESSLPDWIRPVNEPDLLRAFWTLCEQADLVVSFNGRGFDVPFLVTRSLVHGIPARVDLLSSPFALRPHLDLYRVLSQGGRGQGPSSLDVYCWALGIASPKGEMDGSMVAPTYARGDIETIAVYNAGDVAATTAVYQHVRDHVLRFRSDW